QLTKNGETTYYEYNTLNQLTLERSTAGAQTYYQWQADGAMASQQDVEGWTYFTWDVDEALTRIQAPGVTLDNKYNAHMQRVWRSENGIAETLIYDDQKLIAELTTGGLSRYHLSEGGSAYSLLVSQLGSQCWQLFDALGTVIGLTAGDGSLSDTFLYEAFGTSLGRTGTTETPYQYVGGYGYFHEPTVGLEQVWWRWCLAAITRFISVDPLLMNGPGAYTYCENDPVLGTDAAGLWDCRPCAVDWPKGRDTRNLIKQCLKECQKGWRACAKCIAKYGKGKATGLACDYLACCMQGKPRDPHAGPCTDAEVDCQDCVEFDYQKCLCETGGTLSGLGKCYYKSLTGHLQCHCG
ncbi:MAG: RHS repeat-associated core domain-containing protein, partial [Armatimonadia bacterium]